MVETSLLVFTPLVQTSLSDSIIKSAQEPKKSAADAIRPAEMWHNEYTLRPGSLIGVTAARRIGALRAVVVVRRSDPCTCSRPMLSD